MDSLLSAVLPLLPNLFPASPQSQEPSPSQQQRAPAPALLPSATPVSQTRTDLGQSDLPAYASTLATPMSLGAHIDIPFQFLGVTVSPDNNEIHSFDPAGTILDNWGRLYRHVQFLSLEAAVIPSRGALQSPLELDVCWTPRNVTVKSTECLNVSGARRVMVSSAFIAFNEQVLPCPLGLVNPVIKDSVAYSDTPLFWYDQYKTGSREDSPANILFRGVLRLTSPALISHPVV